jgi:pimeloyl-ACP methyl ester carboxylesterase
MARSAALLEAPGPMRPRHAPPPGSFLDVGGHRLHVVCRGSGGPPVVLEAGIAASSLSWTRVQPELAALTRVCAYDRAGLAWSEAPSTPRTFDRILGELAPVVGAAGNGQPVILVGHSFGSLIVRAYAARHPDQVGGLVLVDPPTEWIEGAPERARLLRRAIQASAIGAFLARVGVVRASLALLTGGLPGVPRTMVKALGPRASGTLERLVGEVRKLPPELYPVVKELWCQPKCFRSMAEHLAVLEREGSIIGVASPPPDVPVVVISGGHQPASEIDAHRRLAAASPRGRHLVAAKSGHWILFDEPEIIVDAVRGLIGGVTR